MIFSTAKPYALNFNRVDSAEKFSRPCLITAGDGPEPDYAKFALTDYAKPNEWRAHVPELVAKAERMKPPYVPPPEESAAPSPAAVQPTPSAV